MTKSTKPKRQTKFTCIRCDGTGEEPGAPQRAAETALCYDCGGKAVVSKREYILSLAKNQHEDEGTLEIDDTAKFSEGDDNGTYVAAWVWVPYSQTELCKAKLLDSCVDSCPVCNAEA